MFSLTPTNQFKKDLKTVKKRAKSNEEIIIAFLESWKLPA